MKIVSDFLEIFSNILLVAIFAYIIVLIIKNNYLFLIALRNVFRNKRRTVITILAISVGAIAIILFGGFVNDSFYGLRESTIRSQLGHLQIAKKGYKEFNNNDPINYKLYNFEEIKKTLESDPFLKDKIEGIMPEVAFSGLISTGDTSEVFMARGIDIETDRIFSSFDVIKSGKKLLKEDKGLALLGHILAKNLGAKVGDSLTAMVQTPKVGLNVLDVEVKGTTESFSSDYDKVMLKLSIQDAWLLMGDKYADKLIVLLKNTKDFDACNKRIQEITKENNFDLEFYTWEELATFYKGVVVLYSGIFNFVKLVICFIIIIFITNTLFMTVMERVNEIGTLRTIGTTKLLVMQNFITESIIMGIIGGIVGIILGYLLANFINIFGIPMPPPPNASKGYTANIRLDEQSLGFIYFSFKLSILTAFFAAFLPAKKAIKLSIVDALRHI
ncbi:MAG TPA: ABC transporter permease [Spirochaetota bacterium]|nr:ABC transporter permease [Spirochaetota bacterium]